LLLIDHPDEALLTSPATDQIALPLATMFQVYDHSPPLQLYVNDGQGAPYRGDGKDEICGVDGGLLPGGTGRQPNFLKKLFE
jgi:hypothetical protein